MNSAFIKSKLTFEEYLDYSNDDRRYELVDGELTPMNPPTVRHALILHALSHLLEEEIKLKSFLDTFTGGWCTYRD